MHELYHRAREGLGVMKGELKTVERGGEKGEWGVERVEEVWEGVI